MKKLTIILSFLLFACNAQTKKQTVSSNNTTNTKRQMTTDKFDIEIFDKHQTNGKYHFTLDDKTLIEQEIDNDFYNETINPPKTLSYFITQKRYFNSGQLESILIEYPNDFVISIKEYNLENDLINEINYDNPYKFTFENLLKLIKKEDNTIDLNNRNTKIGRSSDEKGTFWYITYKKVPMRREVLKVDGITGEILERSFYPHEDN